jgi:glycosyltransferase involved in cell wall biosynthesis
MTDRPYPEISVVIPLFNAEPYFAQCLESVISECAGYGTELIIVNDGSTDCSEKIVLDIAPRAKLIRQENRGQAAARNAGVREAMGEFLAFIDADDLWPAGRMEPLLSAFHSAGEIDAVFGHVRQFISPELTSDQKSKIDLTHEVLPAFSPGGMLCRRNSFLRAGLFSEDLVVGEFIDWFMKAKDSSLSFKIIPSIVLKRRLHTSNVSLRKKDMRSTFVHIVKASLDRKRRGDTGGD